MSDNGIFQGVQTPDDTLLYLYSVEPNRRGETIANF